MGQSIEVAHNQVGDVVMFATDRSITGQDGQSFESLEAAQASDEIPAMLAARLFESDAEIDHVFVASNQVVVRRGAAWTDPGVESAADVIGNLFRFYPDA